jgi:drug/metabolite transporter (DMT)-like permease
MRLATFRTSLLGGLTFGASAIFMFAAFQNTTVASATVISSLQPVLLLPYSILRMGESVSMRRIGLTAAAVLGTVVSILGASSGSGEWSLLGDFFAFMGTVFGCLYFIGTKKARETLGSLEYQASAMPLAAVVAFVSVLVIYRSVPVPSAEEMVPVILLVLIPGSGHLLMAWAQKHLSVSATSTIALNITLLSSIGAVFFFDQSLTVQQVVGMVVTLAALALYMRDTASSASAPEAVMTEEPG